LLPTLRINLMRSWPQTIMPLWVTVLAVGLTQIFAWGATYYLLAILAEPIATDTGWPEAWVVGGLSLGLLIAGLISPYVGAVIQRCGGRPVLASSSVILALGLGGLAASSNISVYFMSWAILGVGMGTGLYDAAFATLGRSYGSAARSAITALTLIAGFSSTICWPLSAYLVEDWGWRGVCLFYAALHVILSLPVHLVLVPKSGLQEANARRTAPSRESDNGGLYLLAIALSLIAVISAIMSVYLIVFLEASGSGRAAAVAMAALLGPSQVVARLAEIFLGRYYHPVWTLIAAAGLIAGGLGFLAFGMASPVLAVVLYGGGIGIAWVARGTVPLAVFGPRDYAALMGRLALPSLVAQAISPFLGAFFLDVYGAAPTLIMLFAIAILVLLAAVRLISLPPA
jgi:predicted MFS family arabinose efflux permease